MQNVIAIILAAGRGTRMKSDVPKMLQKLHQRPMLSFVLGALSAAGVKKKILVLGYKAKDTKAAFAPIDSVIQKKLLGSGDAVKTAEKLLSGFSGDVLVLYGDTPFISEETIKEITKKHKSSKASCTLLTANVKNPSGYGRILRERSGSIVKIVEDRDASAYERAIEEINAGLYCFKKEDLFSCLEKLKINAEKREYYLTDIIKILRENNKKIASILCKNSIEAFGVDSKLDLAIAEKLMKKKVLESLMLKGVTIVDPDTTFIDMTVSIGKDTIIYPNTVIEKDVTIGENCKIGPFARLREDTLLHDSVEIGNFVELVRTKVSSGTKIKHLTYLGDAEVGKNVNIGAGTVTANYDGKKKHKTVIEDGSFIGVGAIFIAPVKIGKGALVGAGSVVTKNKNVPAGKTVAGVPAKLLARKKSR